MKIHGHGCAGQGAPYSRDGEPIAFEYKPGDRGGVRGHGKCECGKVSNHALPNGKSRRAWHARHKEWLLTNPYPKDCVDCGRKLIVDRANPSVSDFYISAEGHPESACRECWKARNREGRKRYGRSENRMMISVARGAHVVAKRVAAHKGVPIGAFVSKAITEHAKRLCPGRGCIQVAAPDGGPCSRCRTRLYQVA